MRRLTADRDNGTAYYPYCFRDDTCGSMGEGDCNTCDFSKQVCERLAAYERTGLTPEEVLMALQINKNLVEQLERRWIPVTERLPESGQEVLAYIKHNYAEDGWRAYRVYEYTDHWVGMGNLCEVIAWMPLPEPYRPESLREAGEDAAQGGLMPGA